jgi:hypothetical protein
MKLREIPVIIYSTSISEREANYCAGDGVNCLAKPSTYRDLKEMLAGILVPEIKI